MKKPGSGKPLTPTVHKHPCRVLVVGQLNGCWEALETALGKGNFVLSSALSADKCTLKLRSFHPDAIMIADTLLSKNEDFTSLYFQLRYLLIPIFVISQKPSRISIQEVGGAGTLLVKQLNKYHSTVRIVESTFIENLAKLRPESISLQGDPEEVKEDDGYTSCTINH